VTSDSPNFFIFTAGPGERGSTATEIKLYKSESFVILSNEHSPSL